MEILVQILSSGFVGALAAGFIVWVTRLWLSERIKQSIKNEYDQKLETYKAELRAKSEIELERLRAQLSILSTEHEVRFSRLHQKRAEVIAETYASLKDVFFRLAEYVKKIEMSGEEPRQERYRKLVESHEKFRAAYSLNLIFFPKSTADKLDHVNAEYIKAGNEFRVFVDSGQYGSMHQKWGEIAQRVGNEIKAALADLENEFRKLLGDDNSLNI
ncbi:hypothetical protein [Ferrovibrio xuzhouensis]|uniref:Uncharacterized protein n=1 Tax=Ferrovibrio xuzhouensis TaxID=1576914 RepID=A0ABV7VBX0_9PROT